MSCNCNHSPQGPNYSSPQGLVGKIPYAAAPYKMQADWDEQDRKSYSYIRNKPNIERMKEEIKHKIEEFSDFDEFPIHGRTKTLYIDCSSNKMYRWDCGKEDYVLVSGNNSSSGSCDCDFKAMSAEDVVDLFNEVIGG